MSRQTLIASGIAVLLAGALVYTMVRQGEMKQELESAAKSAREAPAETARLYGKEDAGSKAAHARVLAGAGGLWQQVFLQ